MKKRIWVAIGSLVFLAAAGGVTALLLSYGRGGAERPATTGLPAPAPSCGSSAVQERTLSKEDYLRLAEKASLDAMERFWDPGLACYVSPIQTSSLTNIMMVQAFSILAGQDRLPEVYKERCRTLVRELVSQPVVNEHDGVSFFMKRYGDPHISVSGPYCTALYYAWKNADSLGLNAEDRSGLVRNVGQQMEWVRTELDNNLTGANQVAIRWGLESARAYYRMTGSGRSLELAREYLDVFLDNYSSTQTPSYKRPWVNVDWTWVYDPTWPRQLSKENLYDSSTLSRAEYDFGYLSHCTAGAFFYQDLGIPFPENARKVLSAMLERSLGEWTVGGYPSWISTQLDQRSFTTDYWMWCLFSLAAMTRWDAWPQRDQALSRRILDNSISLFESLFLTDPASTDDRYISNPYGVKISQTLSLNRNSDLALAMFAAYVAMAVDLDIFAVAPGEDAAVWGYENDTRNLYASTAEYGMASGNEILKAYYEDRGDITLLYHGNGRLLSPAYVQEADPPPQWSVRVEGDTLTASGERYDVTYTEQSKPDSVAVSVDGNLVAPADYDTTLNNMSFGLIEKRSVWTRPEYRMELSLTCFPCCILRELLITPAVGSMIACTSYFPNRQGLVGIDCMLENGKTVSIDALARSSIPLTDVRYFHCKYPGYGYVVIQHVMRLPRSYKGRVDVFSPPSWEWDAGRGRCVALTLCDGEASRTPIYVAQIIGFTDGTVASAAERYTTLTRYVSQSGLGDR